MTPPPMLTNCHSLMTTCFGPVTPPERSGGDEGADPDL